MYVDFGFGTLQTDIYATCPQDEEDKIGVGCEKLIFTVIFNYKKALEL